MIIRPYSTPEFLRSVGVVPFDPEAEAAEQKQAGVQASLMFARAQEKERAVKNMRGIMLGVYCALFMWIAAYLCWRAR